MTGNEHRHWMAEEKLQIIEEARQTGQMVSEVCRHHQISAPQFYLWEKQARQGALEALRNRRARREPNGRFQPLARSAAERESAAMRCWARPVDSCICFNTRLSPYGLCAHQMIDACKD